jgi:hypothetical protein
VPPASPACATTRRRSRPAPSARSSEAETGKTEPIAPPTFDGSGHGTAAVIDQLTSGTVTRIYTASRAGLDWSAAGTIPESVATGVIAFDSQHLLISGGTPSDLRESTDGGMTWHTLTAAGLPSDGFTIAGGAIDATHAWLQVEDLSISQPVLLLTADGGQTWRRVAPGPFPAPSNTPTPSDGSAMPATSASPASLPSLTPAASTVHLPAASWVALSIGPQPQAASSGATPDWMGGGAGPG